MLKEEKDPVVFSEAKNREREREEKEGEKEKWSRGAAEL